MTMCREGDSAETWRPPAAGRSPAWRPGIAATAAGELLVRGDYVMLGYLDDPEATARGDRRRTAGCTPATSARSTSRATCTITDRLKDMYISGGFNVYPAEVEQALARLDGVADVAVVGVPDERMGEVGKAYVVRAAGATLAEDDVIAFARERLANFKVPRAGGVRRRAPPQPVRQGAQDRAEGRHLMDLDLSEAELAFQAEARAWLAANVPAEPLPSMDTAEGFARPPGVGGASSPTARWSVVSWPRGVRRPRGVAGRVGDLRGGVLPRRRARPGHPERHLPARPDHLRPRHPGAAGPLPAVDGRPASRSGRRPGPSPRPAPTWPSLRSTAPARRRARRLGAQRPEDLVARGRRSRTGASGCSAPTPTAAAAPRADLLPVPARRRRASPCGRSPSSTARPGFAEIFFDDVFVPDADVLGAPGDGWRVAMSTAGNERGLSLRSPGRFCAAADRLVDLYRVGGRDPPRSRDRVVDAWIRRRPTGSTRGARSPGSPAAATWARPARSTRCSGPSSTSRCTRPRSTCSARRPSCESRWLDGYLFSLSGPIYAGTNEIQRNIVAERILGLPRGEVRAMRFELDRRPARLRGRARRRCSPRPTPSAVARAWADGDHGPGLQAVARLAEHGVTLARAPRTTARRHAGRPVIAFEALGRHAVPGPVGRVRGVPARSRSAARSRASPTRRRARRTCRTRWTPTSPTQRVRRRRRVAPADGGPQSRSVDRDPAAVRVTSGRRLARLATSSRVRPGGRWPRRAQLLGAGERLLADTRRLRASSAGSSAARSAATRRSSTRSPTSGSRSTSPARWSTAAALGPRSSRDVRGEGGRGRRGVPRLAHRAAGARRDRLHRGARPEPVAHQGPGAGRRLGHAVVPPRPGSLQELGR